MWQPSRRIEKSDSIIDIDFAALRTTHVTVRSFFYILILWYHFDGWNFGNCRKFKNNNKSSKKN